MSKRVRLRPSRPLEHREGRWLVGERFENNKLIGNPTGDSYSTGDVLLEIETDKANMDVEAQDDGIMAKIIV